MRYKVKYKIEMTIDDDTYQKSKSINNKKWAIISDPNSISGSLDKIKAEISSEIDDIADKLESWFVGETQNNNQEE